MAQAAPIYVDASATGPVFNGTTWCNAFPALQEGLSAAQPGDEVRVAGGLYKPDGGTGDRWATFRMRHRVSLLGGFAGCGAPDPHARDPAVYTAVLSGDLNGDDGPDFANYADNSYHVVTYDDPAATDVVLDGFTITAGNADGPDGLSNQGSGIHIRQGLVKCLPGGPTIRNCTIEKNQAAHHGAVNDHAAASVYEDCTFRDNFAGEEGAGLLIHEGKTTVVRNCTFERNVTDNEGGAVWTGMDNDSSCRGVPSPTFTGCRFVQNQGHNGGGFFAASFSQPRLSGCSFEGNIATFQGGGLHLELGSIVIESTSFLDNVAGSSGLAGGGGAWLNTALPDAEAVLTDCEFRGNSARQGGGLFGNGFSVLQVARALFVENVAVVGGGLWYNGLTLVTDSTFLRNEADGLGGGLSGDREGSLILRRTALVQNSVVQNGAGHGGGGLALYQGFADIANCWFLGNTFDATGLGGGGLLFNADAVGTVSNSAFSGNSAHVGGGACFSNGTNVRVGNCTFVQNNALYEGDGIATWNATVTVDNSILWDDMPGGMGIEVQNWQGSSQLGIAFSCVRGGWPGGGNFSANPGLLNAPGSDGISGTADDNLFLRLDSPCVNAGDLGRLPADITDLDGDGDVSEPIPHDLSNHERVFGSAPDLGALEASSSLCDPGTFSATGLQPCDPCPAGQSQANTGATTCIPCAPGTHAPSTGAGACTPCAAGTFQPSPGAIACTPCAPGTFTSWPGAIGCPPCSPGTFQPSPGGASCSPCACDDSDFCTTNSCDAMSGACQNEPIPGCSIPAASEWGLLALALSLLIAGTLTVNRYRRTLVTPS
jgi:hypothetical protein